jgi:hypothetical protein
MYEKRRNKSATFCYTLITIALLAGTVAVVISWLLATGVIDPDARKNYKEGRRLDIFRDLNSLDADIKIVNFTPKSTINITKSVSTTETAEIVDLDVSDLTIESDIDENKAFIVNSAENETSADIENAILKKIESAVLIDESTDDTTTSAEESDDQTQTTQIIQTTENINLGEEVETETTTENVIITQEVTELLYTTKSKDAEEDYTDSTEPFTVATITTIETQKEDDEPITRVSLVDILTGTLETTTFNQIPAVRTTDSPNTQ